VIGSGVMGAQIAAHLANAGLSVLLLDIVPDKLTEAEMRRGLTLASSTVRNRLTLDALRRLRDVQPAPLFDETFLTRIRAGNMEDDLPQIREADWIIEAVTEKLDVKRQVLSRIEAWRRADAIVSSNTSGISIHEMSSHLSEPFREHFLGTHFFNPPRYMKLLEIIPSKWTKPEIIEVIRTFAERSLGKGVVLAKDTPNFIANRIGAYGLLVTLREMLAAGLTVDEVDAITGPAMGRPKSATFRTLDLVGLDTFIHVVNNVRERTADEAERENFVVPEILLEMAGRGWLGEKSGSGFYRKVKSAQGSQILSLNLDKMEYLPAVKPASSSLQAARLAKGAAGKLKALLDAGDRYGRFAWDVLKHTLLYAADKVGEIADSIVEIDRAMKWGFNWSLGPFETWDAIGLVPSVKRMEEEQSEVPQWIRDWIASGHDSFYQASSSERFYVMNGSWHKEEPPGGNLSLRSLKRQNRLIAGNDGASLIDIGDGVACLELHSPNNAIGGDILEMIQRSVGLVQQHHEALVIASEGRHFCVGANLMLLLMEAQDENWEEIERIIRLFQDTMLMLKYCDKPVVAAPYSMTLGGGVELCMGASRVCAAAETYYGLVETGVGLIPAGGGCKELIMRLNAGLPSGADIDMQPYVNRIFETIGMAKVSTSAHHAKTMGLLREQDRIVMNRDLQLQEAKRLALQLAEAGYTPPERSNIRVVGRDGEAVLKLGARQMRLGGYISDHDLKIADKLAHVLSGGDVPAGTLVSEQYMLDLEREAFLSLCGEPKTQQRMQHMLAVGKPLRN
jgi:3-hydroxyacyl-CoA dehydrogenase